MSFAFTVMPVPAPTLSVASPLDAPPVKPAPATTLDISPFWPAILIVFQLCVTVMPDVPCMVTRSLDATVSLPELPVVNLHEP